MARVALSFPIFVAILTVVCTSLAAPAVAAPALIPTFVVNGQLILGTILVFLSGLICAGGGIGGGGLYIPIFVIVLGFSPHVAVPLSKCTIVGVAIGSYLVNRPRRHPIANRPLIDYDTACVMEPMTVMGTTIGVFMNVTFPTPILILCLVVLLTVCTYRTFKKGFIHRRKEQAAERNTEASSLLADDSEASPHNSVMPVEEGGAPVTEEPKEWASQELEWNQQEIEDLKEEENKFPLKKVLIVAGAESVLLIFALMKGSTSGKSVVGVSCGTTAFWALVLTPLPVLIGATGYIGGMLRAKYHLKRRIGWVYEEGDVQWTFRNSLLFPFASMFAGIAAGFLGIGGGLVKGPIMLEIGLLPQVVSVTAAFMILFTASSTSIQFMILGRLSWQYAIWYCITGFLGAVGGNLGVAYIVRKYRKESYVAFIIGTAIGLSVIAMATTLSLQQASGKLSFAFHSLCLSPKL